MKSRVKRRTLLELSAMVAMIAISVAGLIELDQSSGRITTGIVLAIFAIVLFLPWPKNHHLLFNHARLAVLTALAAFLMIYESGWNFYPMLFFLLAPMAMLNMPMPGGLIWIGLFALVTGTILFLVNGLAGLVLLLPFGAGYVFFGMFGWVMLEAERNRARSDQLLAELQVAHQQLQEYSLRVEELTITQERNRIAREMHDTLGHRLTIASVQLEGAQRLIPNNPERAVQIIGTVREQVKEGLTELRRTVAMLRASVEEDLPLPQALTRLVDQVQQATALKIHLSVEDCHPDQLQRQALFRAAQEGLTNIQRHANASEAWLQLAQQGDTLELLVSDNGVGISPEQDPSGYGLVGLKERSAILGGEFHIDPRAGGGTTITFSIPFSSKQEIRAGFQPGEGTHESNCGAG